MEDINEVYTSLEDASTKIQEFLDDHEIHSVHADLMLKLEELNDKMYALDLEVIKNASDDLNEFNEDIKIIKLSAKKIIVEIEETDDFIEDAAKIFAQIDKILTQVNKLIS